MNTLTATLSSILVAALLLTPVLDANAKKKKGPKPEKSLMLEYNQDVTPEVIFGDGNTQGFFTTGRKNGVEVALRAKIRFPKTSPTLSVSPGDGTYILPVGHACDIEGPGGKSFSWVDWPLCLATPKWNYEWSVNTDYDYSTGLKVDAFVYELGLDSDPSSKTKFTVFDNISPSPPVAPAFDHAMGDNGTLNGGGDASPVSYLTNIATKNVAQNSWNYEFFNNLGTSLEHFDPSVPGEYTIYLKVKEPGSKGKTVAESRITVLVTAAP
jgi:hypothetical protein